MNHEKFIYYKTQQVGPKEVQYAWFLIDKKTREGVHFHGYTIADDRFNMANMFGFFAAGIESHRQKPNYEGHEPVKGNCIVTGGDCYCDGSSLQASERLGNVHPERDDATIWNVLHEYFGYWIEEKKESIESNPLK